MAMGPVSNADRLAMLLRQRLAERARTGEAGGRGSSGKPAIVDEVRTVEGVEAADDRLKRRRVIEAMLADQFGPGLLNEAEFQQMVDRVVEAIEGDPAAERLIAKVVRDLGP